MCAKISDERHDLGWVHALGEPSWLADQTAAAAHTAGPTWPSMPRLGARHPVARRGAGTGLTAIWPSTTAYSRNP
jgi:hypothetical protein